MPIHFSFKSGRLTYESLEEWAQQLDWVDKAPPETERCAQRVGQKCKPAYRVVYRSHSTFVDQTESYE